MSYELNEVDAPECAVPVSKRITALFRHAPVPPEAAIKSIENGTWLLKQEDSADASEVGAIFP